MVTTITIRGNNSNHWFWAARCTVAMTLLTITTYLLMLTICNLTANVIIIPILKVWIAQRPQLTWDLIIKAMANSTIQTATKVAATLAIALQLKTIEHLKFKLARATVPLTPWLAPKTDSTVIQTFIISTPCKTKGKVKHTMERTITKLDIQDTKAVVEASTTPSAMTTNLTCPTILPQTLLDHQVPSKTTWFNWTRRSLELVKEMVERSPTTRITKSCSYHPWSRRPWIDLTEQIVYLTKARLVPGIRLRRMLRAVEIMGRITKMQAGRAASTIINTCFHWHQTVNSKVKPQLMLKSPRDSQLTRDSCKQTKTEACLTTVRITLWDRVSTPHKCLPDFQISSCKIVLTKTITARNKPDKVIVLFRVLITSLIQGQLVHRNTPIVRE